MAEPDDQTIDLSDSTPVLDPKTLVAQIKVPFAMTVASRRNTGKTYLISQVLTQFVVQKKVQVVMVMSPTVSVNSDYSFLPKNMRRPFSEALIQRMLDNQREKPREKRQQILLVCDDVLSDKNAEGSNLIKLLFVQGRHYNISIILISQSANGRVLTPTIRNNSDWILFSALNRYQLGALWESLAYLDKKEFINYVESHNHDYRFIAVDNTVHSNDKTHFLKLVRASGGSAKKTPAVEFKDAEEEWSIEEDD